MKILILEFWDISPHFETGLEIALHHLILNNQVCYGFWGNQTIFPNLSSSNNTNSSKYSRAMALLDGYSNLFDISYMLSNEFSSWPSFESLVQLFNFELVANIFPGYSVYASMGESSFQPDLSQSFIKERINSMICSYYSVFCSTIKCIEKFLPDRVYVFNGVHLHQHAVSSASKKLGIPVYYHERAQDFRKYVITHPHPPHSIVEFPARFRSFFLNNSRSAFQVKNDSDLFFRRLLLSSPYWANHSRNDIEELMRKKTFNFKDNQQLKVVFFTGSDAEYISAGPSLSTNGGWHSQLEIVLDLLSVCNQLNGLFELVIRIHPNLVNYSIDDQLRWLNLPLCEGGFARIISPSSNVSSYDLMYESDIVLSAGSTAGLEAAYRGIPSIVLAPCFYQSVGCVPIIYSRRKLVEVLSGKNHSSFAQINFEAVDKYASFCLNDGIEHCYYRPLATHSGKFLGVSL